MDASSSFGKKPRLQNACDGCRKRKVRCDSATATHGICSRCFTLGIECTHNLENKRRGPKLGSQLDAARALVSKILSTFNPFVVPQEPGEVKDMLVELANYARCLERQLLLAREASPEVGSIATSTYSIDKNEPKKLDEQQEIKDSIDSLTLELGQVTFDQPEPHFGKSNHFLLIDSAMDARRTDLGGRTGALISRTVFTKIRQPPFWEPRPWNELFQRPLNPLVYPPDDLLCDLIDLYFRRINPIFPLLHRPTFERLVSDSLHLRDRAFGRAVLAVCAVASRHTDDPRTLSEGTAPDSRGWRYFQQIEPLQACSEEPSLYSTQMLNLCVLYLQGSPQPDRAWLMLGNGIRMAQELGMHRRASDKDRGTPEYELRKRAFWLLVATDITVSAIIGRPRATFPEDYDVESPIECDDGFWECPGGTGKRFIQPDGQPSSLSFFLAYLKLLEIVGQAQRTLYSIGKSDVRSGGGASSVDWKQQAVVELDSALNDFMDQIPHHLKWDPDMVDPVFLHQSATLYLTYHWVQIHVHRPFIPRPGRDPVLPFPSLSICSNAARRIIHIAESLQARRDSGALPLEMIPNILIPLFAATMILLVSIWRPHQSPKHLQDSEKDMSAVYRSLQLLQKHENRYPIASCVREILNSVIAVGQTPRARGPLKRSSPEGGCEYPLRPAPPPSQSRASNESIPPGDCPGDFADPLGAPFGQSDNVASISSILEPQAFASSSQDNHNTFRYLESTLDLKESSEQDNSREPTDAEGLLTDNLLLDLDFLRSASMPVSAENLDFTFTNQEDWNLFMSGVDNMLSGGAAEYMTQTF
ncbi:Gypsy retrotransposon integrase-like protein 1 [Marasmius tenuissimus]|nr:Gypsy retrotransposon integrase-like protein 1 [Marasmius tenuissimus]